jgi:hypothetical protein
MKENAETGAVAGGKIIRLDEAQLSKGLGQKEIHLLASRFV